ncbi:MULTISPECIES: hypothetical protein [unclassified Bradyrhizobium]|jgi:hypothetical protein|uniref:hypothetical protein n=1 Tax=unclassified Bradyrhizobium TaxID=2631580 RepID=UPI00104F979C|nr:MULTISPECIES: hypothetical protein [unclassified Bradyrhizobium]
MPVVIAQACACDQKHQAVILHRAPAAAPASTSASLSAVRNIVLGKGRDAAGEFMTAPAIGQWRIRCEFDPDQSRATAFAIEWQLAGRGTARPVSLSCETIHGHSGHDDPRG